MMSKSFFPSKFTMNSAIHRCIRTMIRTQSQVIIRIATTTTALQQIVSRKYYKVYQSKRSRRRLLCILLFIIMRMMTSIVLQCTCTVNQSFVIFLGTASHLFYCLSLPLFVEKLLLAFIRLSWPRTRTSQRDVT